MRQLRDRDRRGRGKKSARILDLIDHYWDQIEKDFFDRNWDARDWIRGERPWPQFLNFCDAIANDDGSRLWAAQLSDERHQQAIEKMLAERKTKTRPGLEGDTALVRGIRGLSNDIRVLLRVGYGVQLPLLEGPVTPADRLAERRRELTRARIAQILDD